MHGVMHVGWVPDATGGYRGLMAVLVKRNGLLGAAYMAAIRPFRHLIVYPTMMREIEPTVDDDEESARCSSSAVQLRARDVDGLGALFSDDVVFRSPVVQRALPGARPGDGPAARGRSGI